MGVVPALVDRLGAIWLAVVWVGDPHVGIVHVGSSPGGRYLDVWGEVQAKVVDVRIVHVEDFDLPQISHGRSS